MRRWVVLAIYLALLSSISLRVLGVAVPSTTLGDEIPPDVLPSVRAQVAIVLDGNLNEWGNFPQVYLDADNAETVSGIVPLPQDSSGVVFSAWDENYLYLAAHVYDDVIVADSETLWWDDSVIFGIDGLHDHIGWQADDHGYVVRVDGALGDFSDRIYGHGEIAFSQTAGRWKPRFPGANYRGSHSKAARWGSRGRSMMTMTKADGIPFCCGRATAAATAAIRAGATSGLCQARRLHRLLPPRRRQRILRRQCQQPPRP